jgi:hypothetical protein
MLGLLAACGSEPELEDLAEDLTDDLGSLCACREIDGVPQCCFGHGECVEQDEGPRRCECDEGARGDTCSTPAPGLQAVRPRACVGDDPGCARSFEYVVVEAFDACVDLTGQRFDSVIVRPASGEDGAWPSDAPLPVAVLTHGAGQDHADYYDLLEHVAANGIVVAAFDATLGQDVTFRANRLLSYLICLRAQWHDAARLSDQYALVGHSRGGAAVAVAADAIAAGLAAQEVEVVAVVALAPTLTGQFALPAAATPAYFTLQGSRDPDTKGASLGWFDDAGEGAPAFVRALTWVFGATHQRFHQGLLFAGTGELQASLSAEGHWTVARAYVGGFLIWRLLGRSAYRRFFTGQELPASVAASFDDAPGVFAGLTDGVTGRFVVDAFEGDALSPSTSGATVSAIGFDEVSVGWIAELDAPWSAAHHGRGVRLDWSVGSGGSLVFELPFAGADVTPFAAISVRLGRTFDGDSDSCGEPGPSSALSMVVRDGSSMAEIPLADLGEAGRVEPPDRLVPETIGTSCGPFGSRSNCCVTLASISPASPRSSCASMVPTPAACWSLTWCSSAARVRGRLASERPGSRESAHSSTRDALPTGWYTPRHASIEVPLVVCWRFAARLLGFQRRRWR